MKRIISIFLCVAMLMSMVAMAVSAAEGPLSDQVTTENVMTITTDKDSYKAGDSVTITAAMESTWGDPELVGDVAGYGDMKGAYGMAILCANLIYDKDVFTAKAHTSLLGSSTLKNADGPEISWNANNPPEAKANGSQYIALMASTYDAAWENYGFFTGAGDLWNWNLTIAANATPGTYYLPVGPYRLITDGNTDSAVIKFQDDDRLWAWNGNPDAYEVDRKVTYKTNCDDVSLVDTAAGYGTDYECAYVKIVIEGDENPEDIANAAAVDALIDAIGTVQNSGDAILVDTINNASPYTHIEPVSGETFTVSFKMMPIAGGETFGYFGGTTDADGGSHNIFWNAAEKKFQIAELNNWIAPEKVDELVAESEVMDLPANKWTEVEYIYNGSNLAVKVNGEIVCSTDSADTGYDHYIMYPNMASLYVKDMIATGDFGVVDCTEYFNADAYSTVTLDSGAAITAAKDAYDALNDNAKSFVTKKAVLDAAIAEYAAIADYNNQVAADKAIALIDAIGTVSYPNSEAAIVAAEEYMATLSETQVALVTNVATLEAARARFNELKGLFDQAKADEVIGYIDAIGEVTFESREAIELAEERYDMLTDDQKALVSNYQTLVDAREAFNLYGPIMNAENLITALGTELYQGTVTHFDHAMDDAVGYYNFPDSDGDSNWWGFTLSFDFMYVDANKTNKGSSIGLFRNGDSFIGYDFKTKSFMIASGGGQHNGSNGPCDPIVTKEYDLLPGKWYNMTIEFEDPYLNSNLDPNPKEGYAYLYLDGELMVEGYPADTEYGYIIFYPQQVDMYIGDNNLTFGYVYPSPFTSTPFTGRTGDMNSYTPNVGIDVISPVDFGAKIQAAEDAVAALTEEQAALLDASYTDALAAIKVAYEPLYAELAAAADEVEAIIDAMTDAASITAAGEAYKALLPGAQSLVENYAALEAALAGLVTDQINALGEITPDSADAIAAAEAAYAAMTDAQKELITNYDVLKAARNELNAMNAAIAKAEGAIAFLQAGGSVLKNVADNFSTGSYSQILDIEEEISGRDDNHAPYTFSMDVLVESFEAVTAEVEIDDATVTPVDVAYIGWASGNDVFVAYDLVNSKFVIANNGAFEDNYAETLAGLNTVYGEAAYDLALNTWYNIEFVVEATYVEILVDGESVLKVDVDVNGYNIFYPVNNVAYYDNYHFSYNGEKQDAVTSWSRIGDTTTWVAHEDASGVYTAVAVPSAGAVKTDADLIAAARAAYDAVPAKAQYAVANYDVLVAAEEAANPPVDPDAEAKAAAAAVDAAIVAIGEVTLDSEAAIAAAREAYNALPVEAQAFVAELATLEAAEAALADIKAALDKEFIHDVIDGIIVPAAPTGVVAEGGENCINVSWDAVDGAVKYWIYVDGKVVASTTATNITVRGTVGDHTVQVKVALTAPYGTVYAAGISEEVAATVVEAAPIFEITSAGVADDMVNVEWTAVEGGTKAWVAITGANAYTHRVEPTDTTFSYSAAKYAGDYSVVVKVLIDGKIIETAAVEFTA